MSFQRSDWRGIKWHCSECYSPIVIEPRTLKQRARGSEKPYNLNQLTCSATCARSRKNRAQKRRRALTR